MGKFLLGAVLGALAFFVYDRQIAGNGAVHSTSAQAAAVDMRELPERDDPSEESISMRRSHPLFTDDFLR